MRASRLDRCGDAAQDGFAPVFASRGAFRLNSFAPEEALRRRSTEPTEPVPYTKAPTLRAHLIGLVIVALVPLALFGTLIAKQLVDERTRNERVRLEGRATTLLSAVDRLLLGHVASLQAVTVAPALQQGEEETFRQYLSRLLATQPEWATINVSRTDGQQVLNLLVEPGQPLPRIPAEDTSLETVLRQRTPVIGDLVLGPSTDVLDFAVRTLISDAQGQTHILSAIVKPQSLDRLLNEQDFPSGWIVLILDRNNRIVTRSSDAQTFRGRYAADSLRRALDAASPRRALGWISDGVTLEGTEVEMHYRRSPESGWSVAVGVPADAFTSAARHAAAMLVAGLILALATGLTAALFLARRISRPIAALVAAAQAIRGNRSADVPGDLHIRELHVLGDALRLADRAVQERADLVKREQDALKAADAAKDRFLAMLAHELRHPLSALRAAAYLVQLGSTEAANAREVITRQTEQMARLIDDLLDVGGIAAGTFSLRRERMELSALLDDVLGSLSMAGRLSHHTLAVSKQEAWVNGDVERLRQVLWNLLDNAVKFTPAGKRIEVRLRSDVDRAVLEVQDQGAGLDPTETERIFSLFARGTDAATVGAGGLGVGLALVRKIVELHGGTVTAVSEGRHRGACFAVVLPLADRAHPAATGDEEAVLPQLKTSSSFRS